MSKRMIHSAWDFYTAKHLSDWQIYWKASCWKQKSKEVQAN